MTLKIGTILIAKEDRFTEKGNKTLTKGNEYPIMSMDDLTEIIFYGYINDLGMKESASKAYIEDNFTIKRYTLQDLKTRTDIMVRIDNEEQAKKLQDAGLKFPYHKNHSFYGYEGRLQCFVWLDEKQQQGRILLDSIDEINLDEGKEEVKEEVKLYPFYYYAKGNYSCNCAVCKESFQGDKRATMCLECAIKQHHIEIDFAYSEIARLKGEVQSWKDSYNGLFRRYEELEKSTPLAVLESTTDLEKRERMAWEIWLQGRYTVEQAIEKVNHFLEESKEVKNEQ